MIASMAGLFVIGDATFNSLAAGSILVVAVAVLGSITVLPALLAKLGRWVDRPRVPLLWRLNRRIGRGGDQRPDPRARSCATRGRAAAGRRGRGAAGAAGAGHEDAQRQPRDAARRSIPEVQTMQRPEPRRSRRRAPPRTSSCGPTPAAAGRRGRRAGRPRGRGRAVDRLTSSPPATPVAGLGGRHDLGAHRWRCRSTSPTTAWTTAIETLRADLAPAALDGLGRGVRRRR